MISSTEKPYISIILPTYNVEKYIERCLKSCISQTCKDIEIIVVDDCGSDKSIAIAEQWSLKDERIKIVKNHKNMGTYHARRVGVEAANGYYSLFLDPDDELDCKAVETIKNKTNHNDVDVVFFQAKQIPENRRFFGLSRIPKENIRREPVQEILKTRRLNFGTLGKAYFTSSAKMAFAFLAVNEDLRLVYAEDALIFFAVLAHTKSYISIHEPLYIYYRNAESITKKKSDEMAAFKSEQISLVVDLMLDKLEMTQQGTRRALNKVPCKLVSDNHLLQRYGSNVRTGKSNYLYHVLRSMASRKSPADAVRVVLFLFTAGLIKL